MGVPQKPQAAISALSEGGITRMGTSTCGFTDQCARSSGESDLGESPPQLHDSTAQLELLPQKCLLKSY